MRRALMNTTAALLLGLAAATAAQAMTPTETVKSRVDEALQGLSQTTSATPESAERRRAEIRRAAERATGLMRGDWPGIDRARR